MLKDYSVLYDNAVRPIYVGISLTCGKNSHDCIIFNKRGGLVP